MEQVLHLLYVRPSQEIDDSADGQETRHGARYRSGRVVKPSEEQVGQKLDSLVKTRFEEVPAI